MEAAENLKGSENEETEEPVAKQLPEAQKNDSNNEITKNKIRLILFWISDFIHFNLGPIAIANKNGIKKGIINLL